MIELIRHCPDCASEQVFELAHPVAGGCPDAPDGECPELWCMACGAALLAGLLPVPAAAASTLLRHQAA